MIQPDLFTLPHVRGSSTSKAAAKSMVDAAPTLKARVLSYITRQGTYGATDEEMQSGIPMAANTQRPRRRELEVAGLIEDTGKTRSTASGRQAVVWHVTGSLRSHPSPAASGRSA